MVGWRLVRLPTETALLTLLIASALTADWIILRRFAGPKAVQFVRLLMARIDLEEYRLITLPQVDLAWENREERRSHRFRTAKRGPHVSVLQKKTD